MVKSQREQGEKTSQETRYFISSLPADPPLFANATRTHWSIENSCHYILDMIFRADVRRIKEDEAVENMAWIRTFVFYSGQYGYNPKVKYSEKTQMNWMVRGVFGIIIVPNQI